MLASVFWFILISYTPTMKIGVLYRGSTFCPYTELYIQIVGAVPRGKVIRSIPFLCTSTLWPAVPATTASTRVRTPMRRRFSVSVRMNGNFYLFVRYGGYDVHYASRKITMKTKMRAEWKLIECWQNALHLFRGLEWEMIDDRFD